MDGNRVKRRLLFLSPSAASGKERECRVEDFESLSRKAIGEGAFGQVYKVRHVETGNLYAIKVIQKSRIIAKDMLQQLRREIRIMYCLDHPNIIKLYNHFEDDTNFYLIMELAEGGSLFNKVVKLKSFDEPTAAQYLRELALAVQYLHTRDPPIIHRDIKPENIFLDGDGRAKLGDFGWSSFSEGERSTYCGTLEYLAPEMIDRSGHDTRLDIWNLGVLLFELLTGNAPFQSKSQTELFAKIKAVKIGFPKSFPVAAKDLVRRLLRPNPAERITIEELLEHTWMRQHPPSRPTATLTTEKQPLPEVPEDNEIKFQDHEYKIISTPDETQKQLAQERTLRVRLRNNILRLDEDIHKANQNMKRLEEKQQKIALETHAVQKNVNDLKIQALQSDINSYDRESLGSNSEETRDTLSASQGRLRQVDFELKMKHKEEKELRNECFNRELRLFVMENTLRGLKNESRTMKWFNSISKLKHQVVELNTVIEMLSDESPVPLISSSLESIHFQLSAKPEIQRVIETAEEDIKAKEIQLNDLEKNIIELQAVLQLQKDVKSLIRINAG